MKTLLSLCLFTFSLNVLSEVYTDISLRPCDPKIATEWQYTPTPVEAPGTPKLPFKCDGDVKVFEITAEEVMSVFDEKYEPGPIYTWGYNGSNPGPVMEILEGEKIRVLFKNKLPEASSIHWHGLDVPYQQDGVPGGQRAVKPGESFVYEWSVDQSGSYMYHAHMDSAKQLSMGLVGFLIIHPKEVPETMVDHDFLYFLQMWALPPHSIFPDVMEMMMFNYFTINGKSAPYIPPTTVYVGQKVRMRFANMSMMEHPVHLHGMNWRVVATGFGDNPRSSHTYGNTILVPTAQPIDVIIDNIKNPGEWMLHCHLPHHVTNNMDVDTIPGEPMDMGNGGMHTVMRVNRSPNDPGYENVPEAEGGGDHGGGHGEGHGNITAPRITTYDGFIKLRDGKRIDVSLELFKAQEEKEWRKVKAFLKVFLNKDEFLVYEYEQVKYNFETGFLNLESEDKSITLSNLNYMDHGDMGMLSGEASMDFGSVNGQISLNTRDPQMRDIRLKSDFSISGEYEGICKDKKKLLQLNSVRALGGETITNNNPLANFVFTGVIGAQDVSGAKVESSIKEGYYDPFKQSIGLKLETSGTISSLNCTPKFKQNKITGLACNNSCDFEKKASNTFSDQVNYIDSAFKGDKTKVISELDGSKNLQGIYSGLISLKNTSHLPLRIKVVAKRYATNAMVITKNYISGVVEVIFPGEKNLTFKITERQFLDSSSKINDNKNVLLLDSHNKLKLVISRWSERSILGDVYHTDYGFMGSFQADKGNNDFLSVLSSRALANFAEGIDGKFSNEAWSLSLESSEQEEGSSTSTYSPLHIKGSLKANDGSFALNIVDGTYDFGVGTIYLKTEDGRIIKGFLKKGEVELVLPSRPVRRTKYLDLTTSRLKLVRN
ncbi:MAG: multicopper oxidase domain-containing protein [Bacteriovoracaceae bacterium]|nr:multicopper oxidase domain-containing protein [Bacteriovoracaceae bacterium]